MYQKLRPTGHVKNKKKEMANTVCGLTLILFIASLASGVSAAASAASGVRKIFDVRSYGARGDGKTDNAIVLNFSHFLSPINFNISVYC